MFPCIPDFFYTIYSLITFWGVQLLLHEQKIDTVVHVHYHSLEQRLHATSAGGDADSPYEGCTLAAKVVPCVMQSGAEQKSNTDRWIDR